ncbi:MAG TPA: DEAD/DEAH box helicase [Agromyces sp.]
MANVTLLPDGRMLLRCDYNDRDVAKGLASAKWEKRFKGWAYQARPETLRAIAHAFPGAQVHRSVIEAIRTIDERERAVAQAKVSGWQDATPVEPIPLAPGIKPFQHQVLGYNVGLQLPNIALLMEMGTGKTLTALAIAARRWERGEVERVLVVAPASVVPVWPADARMLGVPVETLALQGKVDRRVKLLEQWRPMLVRCLECGGEASVVTEDGVEETCGACCGQGMRSPLMIAVTNYEATWRMRDALAEWKADLLIADESQRMKTPGARQSQAMHYLGRRARFTMILSGTPVTQHPLDLYGQYRVLDEGIFGTSYTAFKARYAEYGGYGGYELKDYRNLDELTEKAHRIAYRVTKAEALDLPDQLDTTIEVDLEPAARKLYDQVRDAAYAEITAEASESPGGTVSTPHVLTSLLRLSQITGGWLKDDEGAEHRVSEAKIKALRDVATSLFDAGKKVVVFARFRAEIAELSAELEKLSGDRVLQIHGGIPVSHRGAIVDEFQDPDGPSAIVVQTRAGGLGITLTAADTAVFYSLDYSFADYDQARARVHRIGQTQKVTYVHLVARDSIDSAVLEALAQKKSVADMVVDGWREFLGKSNDHDPLRKVLQP